MLDPKLLIHSPDAVLQAMARRGVSVDIEPLLSLAQKRQQLQLKLEQLQASRNEQAKRVEQAKRAGQAGTPELSSREALKAELSAVKAEWESANRAFEQALLALPNLPDRDTPDGKDETQNVQVRLVGEKPCFEFEPLDHVSLGNLLKGMDFATAAKLSGSRFMLLQGGLARLHRALAQFMLDTHIQNGYVECYTPYLVHASALLGVGQLPKFAQDLFQTRPLREGDEGLWLIPTAEVTLTNLVRESTVHPSRLPLKFVAHTPCFRSEAGSYGKDVRGMIRQHQFDKVELVQMTRPEDSDVALTRLTADAESILQALKLHYRVVALCTGDLGFCAAKTYDLEVWLPGQQQYREISSCSNTRDFQARRMDARYRDASMPKSRFLHTLNGSGLAVGRTLVAVLENYQTGSGTIRIPDVLRPYLGGQSELRV